MIYYSSYNLINNYDLLLVMWYRGKVAYTCRAVSFYVGTSIILSKKIPLQLLYGKIPKHH